MIKGCDVVNIEALSKMPITPEFAELLFGQCAFNIETKMEKNRLEIECDGAVFCFYNDGTIGQFNEDEFEMEVEFVRNAFQIVRYIDNYLNNLK